MPHPDLPKVVRNKYIAAARADHPKYWTCDDLEAVLRRANYNVKPFGPDGPNSDEAWDRTTPITDDERVAFRQKVEQDFAAFVAAEQKEAGGHLTKTALARAARDAIQWTLTQEGIFEMRRRRISPYIERRKMS